MAFPGRKAAIFVHGCFWHGHDCPMFVRPKTRAEFWAAKIQANRFRDERADLALQAAGWRRLVVWECAVRGRARRPLEAVLGCCEAFLSGSAETSEIGGDWT